jgi:hypothetical protein
MLLLCRVILLHFEPWGTQIDIFDPLILRHIASGSVIQIQASDTPLVPTRKIGIFLGTRSLDEPRQQ